jgi:hypothetical protein
MLDPKVVDFFKEEMAMVLKIELLCTGALPINRPSMKRVVDMLQEANPQHKVKATANDGKYSRHYYEERATCIDRYYGNRISPRLLFFAGSLYLLEGF